MGLITRKDLDRCRNVDTLEECMKCHDILDEGPISTESMCYAICNYAHEHLYKGNHTILDF